MEKDATPVQGKRVVVWFHDESIFYANDRRRLTWYHKDATAKPYAKGDGASLMISHVISADYGFLKSHDGERTARRLIKPGKNRDVYFMNDDILDQFQEMVSIAKSDYHDDRHIFIYDNATPTSSVPRMPYLLVTCQNSRQSLGATGLSRSQSAHLMDGLSKKQMGQLKRSRHKWQIQYLMASPNLFISRKGIHVQMFSRECRSYLKKGDIMKSPRRMHSAKISSVPLV
jgi:hypothetical protein